MPVLGQPEVTVTRSQPQVSVQEGATQIEVEQPQPDIMVEIPTINVRVTMPAPRIYVLQGDPEVSVSDSDPQVEVVQGEPEITITQPDPELEIDLGLGQEADAGDEMQAADSSSGEGGDGATDVSGDVEIATAQPMVNFVTSQEDAQVDISRADPEISYSGAEPKVSITMAEQPTVEVSMSGDPEVTIETAEERDERRAQQGAGDGSAPEAEGDQQAMAEMEGAMTVGDLMGMDVVTSDGTNLGAPEAVIESGGEHYLLLSSGGFLDIGDKIVPVPMGNISIDGENLMLADLTEADVERADSFEYDAEQELPDDQPVNLSR